MTAITHHLRTLLTDTAAYNSMAFAHNPYGDGHACQRILQALVAFEESMQKFKK